MDYKKHYFRLMKETENRKIDNNLYYEKHHIIPKSIFNNKKANKILNYCDIKFKHGKENIRYLLAREHFISHILLFKIFKNVNTDAYEKMLYSANFLTNRFKINSKKYKSLREEFSAMLSKTLKGKPSRAKGYKWSEERRKIGQPHLKGKTYEEIHGPEKAKELRKIRSEIRIGKTLEEFHGYEKGKEIRYKLSKRVITKKWKDNISKAKKGKKISQECKDKIKKYMGNDKLNPNIIQDLYEFENIKTKEKIIARRYDMWKKYGCTTIHRMCKGETKTDHGWRLIRKIKNEGKRI